MLVFCPSCSHALPGWYLKQPNTETACPVCFANLSIEIFPAIFRVMETIDLTGLVSVEGEACCYEHANKRAKAVCNQCGRFLCALCEVDIDGKTWCPSCLHSDKSGSKLQALETHRTLYDSIALAMAALPGPFVYFCVFTAPIVLFLAARYWKSPSSLVPRNRWRFVVAILLVLAELGFLAFVIVIALRAPYVRVRPR